MSTHHFHLPGRQHAHIHTNYSEGEARTNLSRVVANRSFSLSLSLLTSLKDNMGIKFMSKFTAPYVQQEKKKRERESKIQCLGNLCNYINN